MTVAPFVLKVSEGRENSPMRILIIEDEARMLELLRKGLYESGYTVMTAPDGEVGLEIALAHDFSAIVLDIGAGTTGTQALHSFVDADCAGRRRRHHSRT
jgi:CheY-like chemotaxis protein